MFTGTVVCAVLCDGAFAILLMIGRNRLGCGGRSVNAKDVGSPVFSGDKVDAVNTGPSVKTFVTYLAMAVVLI